MKLECISAASVRAMARAGSGAGQSAVSGCRSARVSAMASVSQSTAGGPSPSILSAGTVPAPPNSCASMARMSGE